MYMLINLDWGLWWENSNRAFLPTHPLHWTLTTTSNTYQGITSQDKVLKNSRTMIANLTAINIISVRALVRTMLVVNDRIPTDSLRKIRIHWLLYGKRKNGHWDANNISWSQLFSIPLLSALPLFSGSLSGSFQGTASPQKALGCWHHPSPGGAKRNFFLPASRDTVARKGSDWLDLGFMAFPEPMTEARMWTTVIG